MKLGEVLTQEPILSSLICGHHCVPAYQVGCRFPSPGEVSTMCEPPAAGPAREQQMVQEQPRPPEGKSRGLAFVGRLSGGIKHSPCQAVWPTAWTRRGGLISPGAATGHTRCSPHTPQSCHLTHSKEPAGLPQTPLLPAVSAKLRWCCGKGAH